MHNKKWHFVRGKVERFPQKGGWVFVRVPNIYSVRYAEEARRERGLVAITARVGKNSWKTSLLPLGNGSHFIALPKKIRVQGNVVVGGTVRVHFTPRIR